MNAKAPQKPTSGVKFLPWKFDVRVIPRNVDGGIITPTDLDAHLKALPDVAAKAEPVETLRPGESYDDSDDEG